jgi:DNA polymerase elongation subunit (family B)
LVHQDVVRELQRLQEFEDQPLEIWKSIDLDLNKYQSKGLEEELPLEMTYFEVKLPSVMSNNEEIIIKGDKPI